MLIIEEVSLCHIDELYEIEKACFTVPWSKQAFVDEITNNRLAKYYIAIDSNAEGIVGYVGMWHIVDEIHITNIAVMPTYRRKGVASALISNIIDYATMNEVVGITLEVRRSNESAILLYEKYGFINYGIRKNYYTDPKEDAIIMWKRL